MNENFKFNLIKLKHKKFDETVVKASACIVLGSNPDSGWVFSKRISSSYTILSTSL